MLQLIAGVFARKGEREMYDASHPLNMLWDAFRDEAASGKPLPLRPKGPLVLLASVNRNKRLGASGARSNLAAWLRKYGVKALLAQEPFNPPTEPRPRSAASPAPAATDTWPLGPAKTSPLRP
ncbi:hypothetical protein AB0933_12475 [Streptomyces venezuelae]|uniref:hypothetical protein n=1 Tax=Streptomyces venezuelae TaxID=54571 RepID=UPI0034558C00